MKDKIINFLKRVFFERSTVTKICITFAVTFVVCFGMAMGCKVAREEAKTNQESVDNESIVEETIEETSKEEEQEIDIDAMKIVENAKVECAENCNYFKVDVNIRNRYGDSTFKLAYTKNGNVVTVNSYSDTLTDSYTLYMVDNYPSKISIVSVDKSGKIFNNYAENEKEVKSYVYYFGLDFTLYKVFPNSVEEILGVEQENGNVKISYKVEGTDYITTATINLKSGRFVEIELDWPDMTKETMVFSY